ncbi:MASE1 domain-containing protein [Erwinia sp. HDF1-3R]|uniref:MASE1 domain-containing protein n=1 Tax=Erwinia sp. HDF1-3R TaxID=3141543 RepID=UPI0031F47F58
MVKFTLQWLAFCLLWSGLAMLSLDSRDPWSFSTTSWLAGGILFGTLLLSRMRTWPLWLVTSMVLHILCGFYIGRPLPLAALFAVFDGLSIPFCAIAFLVLDRFWPEQERVRPLFFSLLENGVLIVLTFSAGTLLTLCLQYSNYDIEPLHLVSWSLALLTGCLAFWPLAWTIKKISQPDWGELWRKEKIILIINTALIFALFSQNFSAPKAIISGFNPIYLLLTSLLLSALCLNGRTLGILLVMHYVVAIKGTLEGLGPFVRSHDTVSSATWGIWNVQWYVAFTSSLAFILYRFAEKYRLQQKRQAGREQLEVALSVAATQISFRLILPERKLTWVGPISHFFGHDFPVVTLALLEAGCKSPFIEEFESWLRSGQHELFRQHIMVLKSDESIPCLLVITPELPDNTMSGSIAVLA